MLLLVPFLTKFKCGNLSDNFWRRDIFILLFEKQKHRQKS